MATTLIRDGKIITGDGRTAFEGNLLIENDRIAGVFQKGEESPPADAVIDAAGLMVSPGFIDMHSHSDWLVPLEDHPALLRCLIQQGVTTIVGGNCGFSPAPVRPETLKILDRSLAATIIDKPFEYRWRTMGEFLDNINESKPVVNMAELVGHSTLRFFGADTRRGAMTRDEMKQCLDETRRALNEGACGLSLGLGYDPGMYSPLEELKEFFKVAAEAGRPVTVHLKALSLLSPTYPVTYLRAHNIRALNEMLDIARKTGAKLQVSHFIFVGRRSWHTAQPAIELVEKARSEGVDVMVDAFPYTCGNTTVNVVMPYWFIAGLPENYHNMWARTQLRLELELGFRLLGFGYRDFQVMDAGFEGGEDINGLTIAEIALRWGMNAFNTLLKISELSRGQAVLLFHAYSGEPGNESPLEAVLRHDLCLFETDALIKSRGYPNPAAMGTFPRILGKFVRHKKMIRIEDAVRRMTSASAERFRLKDRGTLAKGRFADITIFDPDTIADTPPAGALPAGAPKGIRHVFINGAHILENGVISADLRAGMILRV